MPTPLFREFPASQGCHECCETGLQKFAAVFPLPWRPPACARGPIPPLACSNPILRDCGIPPRSRRRSRVRACFGPVDRRTRVADRITKAPLTVHPRGPRVAELRLYWLPNSCFNEIRHRENEDLEPSDTGPGDRGPSIDAAEAGTAIRTRENPAMAAHDFELKNVGMVASIIGIVVLVLGLVGVFLGN